MFVTIASPLSCTDVSTVNTVDAGNRAVVFDKIRGIQQTVVGEGTHFKIPFIQVRNHDSSLLLLIAS
jgi:hypothetical protein